MKSIEKEILLKANNLIRVGMCTAIVLAGFACSNEGNEPQKSPTLVPTLAPTGAQTQVPATPDVVTFPAKDVIMTVNGEPVDRALVLSYATERGFDLKDPTQLKIATDYVAELLAIAHAARLDAYSTTPEFALSQLKVAASVYVKHLASTPAFTDAEVQANFEGQIAATGGVQLHVQHIIVNQVLAAQTAQAALASGKAFSAVMAELRGTPGVLDAKDLGWITVLSLPEALRTSALALAPGSYTPTPISLGSTSHFLNVIDSKPLATPSFADVKEGMRKAMEETRAERLIDKINAQSKVELR